MVDENLPTSQKNIDSRLTSVNPKDATAHLGDETRNDEEPCYWSDINLQDTGLDFDTDEEISSETSVEKRFDKMEFLNIFQKAVNNMITQIIIRWQKNRQVLNVVNDYVRRRLCLLLLKPTTQTVS